MKWDSKSKETLALRLRDLRREKELTQTQVAKSANISLPQYCRYESAQRIPRFDNLLKIAQVHEVSVDYLLGLTSAKHGDAELEYKINKKSNELMNMVEDLPAEKQKEFWNTLLEKFVEYNKNTPPK